MSWFAGEGVIIACRLASKGFCSVLVKNGRWPGEGVIIPLGLLIRSSGYIHMYNNMYMRVYVYVL